jgi:hypothetical protein
MRHVENIPGMGEKKNYAGGEFNYSILYELL